MKRTLTLIALFTTLVATIVVLYRWGMAQKAARIVAQSNVQALRADTTKYAAVLRLTRQEYKAMYAEKMAIIEAMGYKTKNVQEAHFIRYVYKHDTIARTDTVVQYFEAGAPPANTLVWQFAHGCITTQVVYTPGNEYATDTLVGDITITRLVVYKRPSFFARVFKPRNWWRTNWPTSTVVENNCGLSIKENTVIQIK